MVKDKTSYIQMAIDTYGYLNLNIQIYIAVTSINNLSI